MLVCSNCLHHNPNESKHCEACGMKLSERISCQNCGNLVEESARFCGECGFNLHLSLSHRDVPPSDETIDAFKTNSDGLLPDPAPPEPVFNLSYAGLTSDPIAEDPAGSEESQPAVIAFGSPIPSQDALEEVSPRTPNAQEQPQKLGAALLHEQSSTYIEFQPHQTVIHIGKPNDRVPPDINVSMFASSEVVSRVHADLHIENGTFSLEDVGSANGTYLNNIQLTPGTRYRLRNGDRICLGKGDLVTFVFQTNEPVEFI